MWHVQHESWYPVLLQLCNNIHNETKMTVKAVLVLSHQNICLFQLCCSGHICITHSAEWIKYIMTDSHLTLNLTVTLRLVISPEIGSRWILKQCLFWILATVEKVLVKIYNNKHMKCSLIQKNIVLVQLVYNNLFLCYWNVFISLKITYSEYTNDPSNECIFYCSFSI